jgi:hypothetical protein
MLPELERIVIDRCFKPTDFGEITSCELHTFSDASQKGYGAVTYLRILNQRGDIHCCFLIGKSRLAPLKAMTIPRLELSAAVVATRLNKMMTGELDMKVDESVFWTDSTCVLKYIGNESTRFQTFVANRVSKIQDATELSQWKYVNTRSNPADDASRGLTAKELLEEERWLKGPDFLWKSREHWPNQEEMKSDIPECDPEVRRNATTTLTTSTSVSYDDDKPANDMYSRFEKFSSWKRLRKSIAWAIRYVKQLRETVRKRKSGETINMSKEKKEKPAPLKLDEVDNAERLILNIVQMTSFRDELTALKQKNGNVKRSSPINKLSPEIIDGLLCVGGRLRHAPLENTAKHQVILPKQHHVATLIARHYHQLSGHSGLEYVLSLTRQKFWIVKGRLLVRRVVNDCFDCRRRQSPVAEQKMADLPKSRVTPSKPPFTFTGVDCFGPFNVRRGRSLVKRYGVIFTCLTTRAIHIEVASSLDTDSFLNALRRFVARRGNPEEIRSDNGGNFVSGEKELRSCIKEWNQDKIHQVLLLKNIKWNQPRKNVEIGDVVLLLQENTPRSSWPLARVIEVHRNRNDGHVRSVKLKTATSVLERPICKIVVLEGTQ